MSKIDRAISLRACCWLSVVGVVLSACTGAPPAFDSGAVIDVNADGKHLSVTWPKVIDADFKHYAIFVDDKIETTTKKNEWTLTTLRPWQSVRLRVEAVDQESQRSSPLVTTARAPDRTPPVFPANAKWNKDESAIAWRAASDDGELASIRVLLRPSAKQVDPGGRALADSEPSKPPPSQKVVVELPASATEWIVDKAFITQEFALSACDAAGNCTSAYVPERPSVLLERRLESAKARRTAISKKLAGKGLLALIGNSGGGSGSVADIFGDGGFGGDLDRALSGNGGLTVSNIGTSGGGLGVRGGGLGGGGGIARIGNTVPSRKDAATGRMRMSILNTVDVDKKTVTRSLRQRLGRLRACSTSPTTTTVVLRVALSATGDTAVNVKTSSGDITLDRCLSRTITNNVPFPRPKTKGTFDVSLRFGP